MTRAEAIAVLQARARGARARASVRSWEYRQRHRAKGAWFQLRRLLAATDTAWRLPEEDARRLLAEGYEPAPAGSLLEPPKLILVVPEARLRAIAGRVPVDLRLGPELLAARFLGLVPFRPAALTPPAVPRQAPSSSRSTP